MTKRLISIVCSELERVCANLKSSMDLDVFTKEERDRAVRPARSRKGML